VCAKVYADRIQIAADSITVSGWSKRTDLKFSKLSRINDIVMGTVGTIQEASLMWNYMETHKPKDTSGKSILDFMVEFSKWKSDYSTDKEISNYYIMAFSGKYFLISGSWVEEIVNHCAIGAGEDLANAALYLGHTPREAVKVAAELSCFVAEPIVEEEVKRL